MSERFKKVSSKRYQIEIDGAWVDVHTPYGKIEKLVSAFFAKNGTLNSAEEITMSIPSLIANFGEFGDILLSTYDSRGNVIDEMGCRDLSYEEVTALFEVAADCINSFIEAVAAQNQGQAEQGATAKTKTTKTR